jgi:hypothetical protein
MSVYKTGILGLRVFQIICIASVITGFIWSSSDLLLATVLVDVPVTPLSVLMMLYGVVGVFGSEGAVRFLGRKERFLEDKEKESG